MHYTCIAVINFYEEIEEELERGAVISNCYFFVSVSFLFCFVAFFLVSVLSKSHIPGFFTMDKDIN